MITTNLKNAMRQIEVLVNDTYTGDEDEHREAFRAIMDICKQELNVRCPEAHHSWLVDNPLNQRANYHCYHCGEKRSAKT